MKFDINRWCELAEIPFDIVQDSQGNRFKRFIIHKPEFKQFKQWLIFILSSLKISTDQDLLAQYYKSYLGYADIFFNRENWLFELDKIAQVQLASKSSLNIVFTGLGSLTGCGKSYSSAACCIRWSPIDEKGRVLFSPRHILMEESEIKNIEGFKQYFYSLDDPELNSVGMGINAIKQRLDKFMRIVSRYGQTSLNICSAIDILKTNRLSLDGIHYYIEMLGVNAKYEIGLGMLYDRFYNPKGWVIIPSPLKEEIVFYSLEQDKKIKREILCYDPIEEKEYSPKELIDFYEKVMKKNYVERILLNQNKSRLKELIEDVYESEKFQEFIFEEDNQVKAEIEAWLHTEAEIKLGSLKEYSIVATRLLNRFKKELRSGRKIIAQEIPLLPMSERFKFDSFEFVESLLENPQDKKQAKAWLMWKREGKALDVIGKEFKVTGQAISLWCKKVRGKISERIGTEFQNYCYQKLLSESDSYEKVNLYAGQSEPDLVAHNKLDGSIEVYSIKCYNNPRKSIYIYSEEHRPEIIFCQKLAEQGLENIKLFLWFYEIERDYEMIHQMKTDEDFRQVQEKIKITPIPRTFKNFTTPLIYQQKKSSQRPSQEGNQAFLQATNQANKLSLKEKASSSSGKEALAQENKQKTKEREEEEEKKTTNPHQEEKSGGVEKRKSKDKK